MPELTPHMIEIIDNVYQVNKGSNKSPNAAKIRKYVEDGIGCQLDAPLNRALVAQVNALTNGKVTSAPKTQAHQTKTALTEEKGIEAVADKSDKAPSNVEQVTTSATSNVEEQVTAPTDGGSTEAALKKCNKASSHVEEQETGLTNVIKKFIDKLFWERKESSIQMKDYRNALEREIGSFISKEQWKQLKEWVRGLSDGRTLPYDAPTNSVEANLPKGKEAESIDTLDRDTLDELQTLPQYVKNFIDDVLAKPSRTRVNVVERVVKRLNCSAIPENFKTLILEYSKVVQEQRNDPEDTGTSLQDDDEGKRCHVCAGELTTGEIDTCVLCNQVVHNLCRQDSGQISLHCNSCHLEKLKGYFQSLKEVPLKLISHIDYCFNTRERDDTAETLVTKMEVTWRFLGTKLPSKQRRMVIKHLEGLLDGTITSTVTTAVGRAQGSPKEPGNYTVTYVDQEACPDCHRSVFKEDKGSLCKHCNIFTHSQCGANYKTFTTHRDDASGGCLCTTCVDSPSMFLCYPCGTRNLKAEHYRKAMPTATDSDLAKSWFKATPRREVTEEERERRKNTSVKRKRTRQELEEDVEAKAIELQQWLKGIVSVKHSSRNNGYFVKSVLVNGEERSKLLAQDFVEESVLMLDEDFIALVKDRNSKAKYHLVPLAVIENVKLRAELWAGDSETYDDYNKCLQVEAWTHFKVNYRGPTPITPSHRRSMRLVDGASHCTDTNRDYYVSLLNKQTRFSMTNVPKYYIFLWKVVQNYYHAATESPNDINLVEKITFEKPNTWIDIPEERMKRLGVLPERLQTVRFQNVFLQGNESSCVIISLANALMYINDKAAAYELMKHKQECLATNRRLQFVTTILRNMRYTATRIVDFDILNNASNWPTVCGLTGSDGGRGHAVSVCGEVLFDGNLSHALKLSKENLSWCCGAPGTQVDYVKVHLAYRYEILHNIPQHLQNL